jgi:CRISPR/Cas system type I-B associated protein Csh2 (Cas7 group RAMP superfamily)
LISDWGGRERGEFACQVANYSWVTQEREDKSKGSLILLTENQNTSLSAHNSKKFQTMILPEITLRLRNRLV